MTTYRVFNENNALVDVTDADLDAACASGDVLPTHMANATGVARRHDLIPQLRSSLAVSARRNKLAAARALLAVGDRGAIELLRERARTESDAIVANVFRGIALRLEGVAAIRHVFEQGDDDPAAAGAIASVYIGRFDLAPEDVEFLLDLVDAYVAGNKRWIAAMSRDEWRSDLYALVKALSRAAIPISNRARAQDVLARVLTSHGDRDTKKEAQNVLAKL